MSATRSKPSLNTSYLELWHRLGIALPIFTTTLLVAYWSIPSQRTMQRKPMWLVEVSIASGWRAAGR